MGEAIEKTRYQKFVDIAALCIAAGLCIFQMYSASFGTWSSFVLSAVHWGVIGSYIILRNPLKIKAAGPIIDWALILVNVYICIYQILLQDRLVVTAGFYTTWDIIVGAVSILLILEMGRRSVGKILPFICILFLLYCYFGNMVPGLLKTARFTIRRISVFIYTSSDGLFGQTIYVSAKYIFLFILFGCILELTGAGKWFVDLAYAAFGKARGGPAQAAVYSSMLMGTINGSGAANVVTTGTFTIPLMKKIGLKPSTAGAVEAVASSGGQIMPPVMGAVAFLMAEMTGIEYAEIAIAALVPAALYYATLSVSVYLIARRENIAAASPDEVQPFWQVFKSGWLFAVPLVVLVYLIIAGFSVQMSAFWSIWVTLAVGFIMNRKEMTVQNILAAFAISCSIPSPSWTGRSTGAIFRVISARCGRPPTPSAVNTACRSLSRRAEENTTLSGRRRKRAEAPSPALCGRTLTPPSGRASPLNPFWRPCGGRGIPLNMVKTSSIPPSRRREASGPSAWTAWGKDIPKRTSGPGWLLFGAARPRHSPIRRP